MQAADRVGLLGAALGSPAVVPAAVNTGQGGQRPWATADRGAAEPQRRRQWMGGWGRL